MRRAEPRDAFQRVPHSRRRRVHDIPGTRRTMSLTVPGTNVADEGCRPLQRQCRRDSIFDRRRVSLLRAYRRRLVTHQRYAAAAKSR